MSLLSEITQVLNESSDIKFATGEFYTDCQNRIADTDDYIVVVPQPSIRQYSDDHPAWEVQNVRVAYYAKGDWDTVSGQLLSAFISAGVTVTNDGYGGYIQEDDRHVYNIDLAKLYPAMIPTQNESEA